MLTHRCMASARRALGDEEPRRFSRPSIAGSIGREQVRRQREGGGLLADRSASVHCNGQIQERLVDLLAGGIVLSRRQ